MAYIIKNESLELYYEPGKGSWTYHLTIPNTANITGKWGDIKVSGYIDSYRIEAKNLAPTKQNYKLLAVNSTIRKAINKCGGDRVIVTLELLNEKEHLNADQLSESLKDSGVLPQFKRLSEEVQQAIMTEILSQKSDEKQIEKLVVWIDKLNMTK